MLNKYIYMAMFEGALGSINGIRIRVDNRVKDGRLIPDKKYKGFMKCNQKLLDRLKNSPDVKKVSY